MAEHSNKHIVRRASFDIGSATTKLVVADMDLQKNRIANVVLKDTCLAGYKKDLQRPGSDGTISASMLTQGVQALQELKAEALKLDPVPTNFCAVATAAFRVAKNGHEIAHALEQRTGIPVTIINQDEEARLGFQGGIAKTGIDAHQALVWDVGGGSLQMSLLDADQKLQVYGSQYAFLPFTQMVIKELQQRELDAVASPNPVSLHHAEQAIKIAFEHAAGLPEFIKQKIKSERTQVIGIGALYYASVVVDQPKPVTLTQDDIYHLMLTKLNKTDQQLESITNKALPIIVSATSLAFMVGFMRQLVIEKISVVEVNMNDGMLLDRQYCP